MNFVEKALQFAALKHEGQYRKGTNIPYIIHPVAVAMLLKDAKYGDDIVTAGLLHDTLEDTETTETEILQEFGGNVLQLVKSASEPDKTLSWEKRKMRTIAELSMKTTDELAVIVADKLHNIQSIYSDVEAYGDEIWLRFNRGKREQSRYYMGVVKALQPRREEVKLVKKLEKEVYRLFVGHDKLTAKKIDQLFEAAYSISDKLADKLQQKGLLKFVQEAREKADGTYQNHHWELVEPLFSLLEDNGVKFEMNSDGPMIILSYCAELKHRLAWTDDEFVIYFKRNIQKL